MDEQNSTPVKTCTKCKEEKPVAGFNKDKSTKDGYNYRCRHCSNARISTWIAANSEKHKASKSAYKAENAEKIRESKAAFYLEHADRIKAKSLAYYAADPEKGKQRSAIYRAANQDKVSASIKTWVANNSDKVKLYKATWRQKNPEIQQTHWVNRRARKIGNGGKLSKDIVQRLTTLQRGLCACGCGAKLKDAGHHIDHIQPLAKGGSNTDENCQLLTPKCNMSKGAKCPIEWAQSKGFLL